MGAGGPTPYTYEILEDVEYLEHYGEYGFHPIHIGDTLHDERYRIVDKLGFGGYSTVWLAREEARRRYVAVKVGTADSDASPHESLVLERLSDDASIDSTPGSQFMPRLLDKFTVTGPNGSHPCLVTAPARMSLHDAKEASNIRLYQPRVARAIIRQLVEAVRYMHSRCVVHGDIRPSNLLLALPSSIDRLTPEALHDKYEPPLLQPIKRQDGLPLGKEVPTYAVSSMWLGESSEDVSLARSRIIVSDFGESYLLPDTSRTYSNSPASYAPPEGRFGQGQELSYSADIWSLACTIWDIIGQRPLFEPWAATADDITSDQVDLLGKLPADWWALWDARREYFTEDGEVDPAADNRSHDSVRRGWEHKFSLGIEEARKKEGMEIMCDAEKLSFLAMMKSMLIFQPKERPSAEEVLKSEWMVKWALPDLEAARAAWDEQDAEHEA